VRPLAGPDTRRNRGSAVLSAAMPSEDVVLPIDDRTAHFTAIA
jgi:hypothetical protein